MKKVLTIFCILMAVYAIYFPFSYFGKNSDKKEIRVSHILVSSEKEANEIKQNLNEGKNFEDMVKKYSTDEYSKDIKGDIGYNSEGKLDKNINEAIFKMSKNQISDPVESKHGWHVIKVTDVKYYSDSENFKYNKYKYLKYVN